MEPSYVGFLLSQAYQLTVEKKGTLPQDFLSLKSDALKSVLEKPYLEMNPDDGQFIKIENGSSELGRPPFAQAFRAGWPFFGSSNSPNERERLSSQSAPRFRP
jgi:hypothetical protein